MKDIFGKTSITKTQGNLNLLKCFLLFRALPVVTFESWKNTVESVIREEARKGVLCSVNDVSDEAVKLLSNTDSEMEKTVYSVSGLREAILGILVLYSPNYRRINICQSGREFACRLTRCSVLKSTLL